MTDGAATTLRKRSVTIAGHRTSVSLEAAFWAALQALARSRRISVSRLIGEVDAGRGDNLSSALRVHILDCARRGMIPVT